MRYHMLTVEWLDHRDKNSQAHWKCKCDCWNIKIIRNWDLWKTQSCWCLLVTKNGEILKKYTVKHWMNWTRFYNIWRGMKWRCSSKSSNTFKYYGGRWILCDWMDFNEFKTDMYQSYLDHVKLHWENNTTIDRINVELSYCKENCKWSTWDEQSMNKRTSKTIEINWITYTYKELADEIWIWIYRIWIWVRRWWSNEKISNKVYEIRNIRSQIEWWEI